MCGIAGKFNFDSELHVSPQLITAMLDSIRHRGPDDEGVFTSGPIGLGHRRLSIIDLGTGHQPLANEDETVWIVFNGEIYNYKELRSELLARGHTFRTQTDTEVIVHLYEELGEACVEKLRGMFAFAIWDARDRTLFLARDRVGIKPLYYSLTGRSIAFGSELKAILADPEITPECSPEMVDRFLTFYYMPGEETLLRNIKKLPPGACISVKDGNARIRRYWDLEFTERERTLRQAEDELVHLLEESVRMHMISDVPVGFLLSGGVDSTAMLCLAAQTTQQPLSSFTVGFSGNGFIDERPYAELAARTYGTDHYAITIGADDFQRFLPDYVWHMEEPVCEPPAIALYYVSRFASEHVKVLISGEGGDEAFAGYQNYRTMLWMERFKKLVGQNLSHASRKGIGALNTLLQSDRIANYVPLLSTEFDNYYYSRTSTPYQFFNSHTEALYSAEFKNCAEKKVSLLGINAHWENAPKSNLLSRMLYADTKTWLVDDLLLKADKMTMANSVELRVPLLDHRVLEFAASLPASFKVRGLTTKYIAKKVFQNRVPRAILQRKKAGFPVPYATWMRSELRSWVSDLLMDGGAFTTSYFDRIAIQNLLRDDCQTGRYSKEVFSLVVLELWHRAFLPSRAHNYQPGPAVVADSTCCIS